jgi:hypothetical protein
VSYTQIFPCRIETYRRRASPIQPYDYIVNITKPIRRQGWYQKDLTLELLAGKLGKMEGYSHSVHTEVVRIVQEQITA